MGQLDLSNTAIDRTCRAAQTHGILIQKCTFASYPKQIVCVVFLCCLVKVLFFSAIRVSTEWHVHSFNCQRKFYRDVSDNRARCQENQQTTKKQAAAKYILTGKSWFVLLSLLVDTWDPHDLGHPATSSPPTQHHHPPPRPIWVFTQMTLARNGLDPLFLRSPLGVMLNLTRASKILTSRCL